MPFPEEVRRAIEAQNPGVVFDWKTLANTPFPSQEPEFWRERRRAEKAAKQARREEEALETDDAPEDDAADAAVIDPAGEGIDLAGAEADGTPEFAQGDTPMDDGAGVEAQFDDVSGGPRPVGQDGGALEPSAEAGRAGADGAPSAGQRRRRRRGGKRRRGRPEDAGSAAAGEPEPDREEPGDQRQIGESDPSIPTDSASEDQE
jgi:ribonuclease E